jgi:phenylacetate-coenzyme A ligase PaaK-like adenylate-forming protein
MSAGVTAASAPAPPFDPWRSAAAVAEVQAASHASRQSLAALQAQRVASLLQHAVRESPLYRDWMKGRDPAALRLQDFPVVRKPLLMQQFDRWVTDPALRLPALRRFTSDAQRIAQPYLGRYVVWESSGSSGEPGVFVQDTGAMAVYDALEALRRAPLQPLRRWLDPWFAGERIVFVGATGGHFASTVSVERLRRLNPVMGRLLHSVSFLQPTRALVAELQALQPSIVATYPTAAVLLAEEQLAGRLRIAPREVWTGGETLTPCMRRFVRQAFGCPVANSYGASEFLALASECRQGGLHLNADWAVLEPVDEQGRPVPPGQPGSTVLLTNLANHVQPLIRYDLGDRVTLRPRACACGSALPLIDVQGRCDDSLRLGAASAPVRVLPLALSTVLEEEAGLYDFQLVQRGPCDLQLNTGLRGREASEALRRGSQALSAYLSQLGAPQVRIRCQAGRVPHPARSGKLQRVIGLPA